MKTLKDIVTTRLKQLGIGAVEAATAAGLERTFIRDIVEDKKKTVRADSIAGLARALSLNPSALANGELVPLPHSEQKLVSSFDPDLDANGNGYSEDSWSPIIPGAIPEIDVRLGAGEGSVGEMISLRIGEDAYSGHKVLAEWVLSETFIKHEAKASPAKTIVVEVIGDSMSPTYQPGDRVLVDLSQKTMRSDTVYAISDGLSEPQIKRLQRVPFSDPARVKIISDNPALETFEVVLDRLYILGRVCGHIAKK
ncbi:S24 family peptidase [Nitratireductor indicus]|uniref:S24 family peptidase n=1 Tax=Nitratireductor indicus TaxID=721133 RepID=UPI0028761465|nr:S24 family peptidase [Nitratireductor indicus]MDS1135598.1 S24 family peptidase [Nitratireductor indicus]